MALPLSSATTPGNTRVQYSSKGKEIALDVVNPQSDWTGEIKDLKVGLKRIRTEGTYDEKTLSAMGEDMMKHCSGVADKVTAGNWTASAIACQTGGNFGYVAAYIAISASNQASNGSDQNAITGAALKAIKVNPHSTEAQRTAADLSLQGTKHSGVFQSAGMRIRALQRIQTMQ